MGYGDCRDRIDFLEGDLTDLEIVSGAVRDVDWIFHFAAPPSIQRGVSDPLRTNEVCAGGTLNLLLAAREARVQRVIYGGSAAVYGDGQSSLRREYETLLPASPYAVAMLAGEHYCAAFSYVHGLDTVRLRFFNVFGPRQLNVGPHAAVIPAFIEEMLAGRRPVIHGDGLQSRDFLHVDDVVQACLLAAEAPRASGRVYNIGSGRRTTILELVDRINLLLGTELRPIFGTPRPGDIRHSCADIGRAQAELGFCPCTDLALHLPRCLEAYAALRKGPKSLRKAVFSTN